jgi:Trypsin-like peptidase domain
MRIHWLTVLGIGLALSKAWAASPRSVEPESSIVLLDLPGGGRGSGIILSIRNQDNDILVLTAYHNGLQKVLDQPTAQIEVRFWNTPASYRANVVDRWIDTDLDLAVLRIPVQGIPKRIRAAQFGDSRLLKLRDPVVAIGHRVDGGNEEWLSDNGIVAQPVGPRITFSRTLTDRGFSGGPLFNSKWEVVGLITDVGPGLGYAKNSTVIQEFLRPLGLETSAVQQKSLVESKALLSQALRYAISWRWGNANVSHETEQKFTIDSEDDCTLRLKFSATHEMRSTVVVSNQFVGSAAIPMADVKIEMLPFSLEMPYFGRIPHDGTPVIRISLNSGKRDILVSEQRDTSNDDSQESSLVLYYYADRLSEVATALREIATACAVQHPR